MCFHTCIISIILFTIICSFNLNSDAGDATATPEEEKTQAEGDKPAVAKSLKCDE